MAHVNLETKTIYGAEPDSLSYYHELGHIAFIKSENGESVRLHEELSKDLLFIVFLACFWFIDIYPIPVKLVASFFVARWLYYYAYEEVWCWAFAFRIKKLIKRACDDEPADV